MSSSEIKEILKGIKGFRDFYPEDFDAINHILHTMHMVSRQFGYEEYEGPSIEFAKLIEIKSGPAILEETFTLVDKEGRKLVLRPEQTPTLARMIVNQHQRYPKPIRWYSIPRIFRDETPQRGRVKEFFQYNADIIGIDHVAADAEIIALTTKIIKESGLKDGEFKAVINSRELVQAFVHSLKVQNYIEIIRIMDSREKYLQEYVEKTLNSQGIRGQKARDLALFIRTFWSQNKTLDDLDEEYLNNEAVMSILEHLDEIMKDVTINTFKKHKLSSKQAEQLYIFSTIKGAPNQFVEDIHDKLSLSTESQQALNKMESLIDYLDAFHIKQNCEYNAAIARGLDYYTGIVFEFVDQTGSVARAIAGGGRYDQLVQSLGGEPLPAVGIGMGETVLLSILKELGRVKSYKYPAKVYIAPIKNQGFKEAAELAEKIRAEFDTVFNPYNWSLSKHLEYAGNRSIPITVIIGKRDLQQNMVTIRDMITGKQALVKFSDVLSTIEEMLSQINS